MNVLPVFPSSESKLLGTSEHPWDEVHAKKYYVEKGNEFPIENESPIILTGMIIPFAGNAGGVPVGYLLCDGSAVSRTDYSELFEVIGTTYGAGDGSTTFALPNLIDRVIQGSATAGTYKEAGLPNITGTYTSSGAFASYMSGDGRQGSNGAISWTTRSWIAMVPNLGGDDQDYDESLYSLDFNASKSNSIYGKSATVQPPALTMLPIIKY